MQDPHRVQCVPTFELCLEHGSGGSLALHVPCSFIGARYERLVAFLAKEHLAVTASASAAACLAGCSERELHAAELIFIRQLGTLRTRSAAVPEKTVGKLLGIGVKALHARCQQLFGCTWAQFLGLLSTSSQAVSSSSASCQPSPDEEMVLCPAAAPSTTAAAPSTMAAGQPTVVSAAAVATTAPSAATAATLEPLLGSCFVMPNHGYQYEEQYDVLGMLLGPCQAPVAAAGPAVPTAAAPTATPSCGCATGLCCCGELKSILLAGQRQQQQQQRRRHGVQLPAPAEWDACFPPTPAATVLPLMPAVSDATVQQLQPADRLSSSLARLLAELDAVMQEPPFCGAAPTSPAAAAHAVPAAPGLDALLALDIPEFPLFPIPYPTDPQNMSSAAVADFPSFL